MEFAIFVYNLNEIEKKNFFFDRRNIPVCDSSKCRKEKGNSMAD